jgi:hypothetical protein
VFIKIKLCLTEVLIIVCSSAQRDGKHKIHSKFAFVGWFVGWLVSVCKGLRLRTISIGELNRHSCHSGVPKTHTSSVNMIKDLLRLTHGTLSSIKKQQACTFSMNQQGMMMITSGRYATTPWMNRLETPRDTSSLSRMALLLILPASCMLVWAHISDVALEVALCPAVVALII